MTAPRKQIGKGTAVFINGTEYGRIENAQLPDTEFAIVESEELIAVDDSGAALATEVPQLGDLIPGDWEFTQYYDPAHTSASTLDSLMAAKAEVTIKLVTPHSTAYKIEGKGLIYKMGVGQIVKRGFYKRTVTIRQTSPLTVATNAA